MGETLAYFVHNGHTNERSYHDRLSAAWAEFRALGAMGRLEFVRESDLVITRTWYVDHEGHLRTK